MRISSIPQIYRHVNRWREILAVLSKYGLAGWISRVDLPFGKGLLKNRDGEALAALSREARIRMALEELGPTFVKFGQILSTRPDLIGLSLAEELSRLQANAPADRASVVRALVETELGQPIDELFSAFDDLPLASASIGQVHAARLPKGEQVVVKVLHYGIQKRVYVDLEILLGLAQLAERIPEFEPYRPRAMIAEFQRVLRRELDFGREERNLLQFAQNFAGSPNIRIPKSYPGLSTSRVLTMERLEGIPLCQLKLHDHFEYDHRAIARAGAEAYLDMVFRHGFYHADPHPGNLLILAGGKIGLLDFGMVGRLEDSVREDMEDMLLAISAQDSGQLTSIVMRIGSTPPGLDEGALGIDLADFVAHFANQPLESLDLSGALNEMIEIIRRHHIVLPASIGLLLKMLIVLEGTGRMLQPSFSLMEMIQPYQKRMLLRRISPVRHAKKLRRILYEVEQLAELLPRRVREILQQVQTGKFDVHLDHRGLEPSINRLVLGMLTSALFLGSSLLVSRGVLPWYDVSVPGAIGCSMSVVLGLRLLRAINKSGRLDRR
jgi:ubiquinone biosynthesis protein